MDALILFLIYPVIPILALLPKPQGHVSPGVGILVVGGTTLSYYIGLFALAVFGHMAIAMALYLASIIVSMLMQGNRR